MSLPPGGPWARLVHRLRRRVQAIQAVDDSKLKWVLGKAGCARMPSMSTLLCPSSCTLQPPRQLLLL